MQQQRLRRKYKGADSIESALTFWKAMDLLTNAITSVRLGVDDYSANSDERVLSSVRNIHSGILLLFKEALRRKSPEGSDDVLVKAHIQPRLDDTGKVFFVGKGKKTVDVSQIKERFQGLGIDTNWNLMDKLTEARNELEHYAPKHTKAALEGLLTIAFTIVQTFVREELGEDPLQLLGDATWQTMLNVATVHEKELADCKAARDEAEWYSEALAKGLNNLSCSDCGSDLLRPFKTEYETTLECARCGSRQDRDVYVPKAIRQALAGAAYSAMKDGGDEPYTHCPECGEEAYVMAEQHCALCHAEAEHQCQRCGCGIPASEMICSPYCGYCQHMYERMLED